MTMNPLRLILSGYTIAAVAGILAMAAGAGVVSALLTIWLGGAVCVLALAAAPGFRVRRTSLEAAGDLHADLRRWECDRAADAARPEKRRAVGDD